MGWLISKEDLEDFVSTVELNGITDKDIYKVRKILSNYLKSIEYKIDKDTTIYYLKNLMNSCSISHYRKQLYQIKKSL